MALGVCKYSVSESKPNSQTYSQYMDDLLDSFVYAIQLCSPAWEERSSKETVGNPSHSNFCCRTILLQSTQSKEYLRVWALYGNFASYYATVRLVDVEQANPTSGYDFYMYRGNVFKYLVRSPSTYGVSKFSGPLYFFGVSDRTIPADFGYDLGLKLPIFSPVTTVTQSDSWTLIKDSEFKSASVTVMSDGSMFSVFVLGNRSRGSNTKFNICLYAPDLIQCANDRDICTQGVLCSNNDYGFDFYIDNYSSPRFGLLFTRSDGSFNFDPCKQPDYYINTVPARSSSSSGSILAVPMTVFLQPLTQSGSDDSMVIDGVGFKGWVDMKYVKFLNPLYSGGYSYGRRYDKGAYISAGNSVLVCWDGSNINPFI